MNNTRQHFGTHLGSNRPVSLRQRALFARGHLGRGYVAAPLETWPSADADAEIVPASPRFVIDFNGQRPAGMTVNLSGAITLETSLPAAA